MKPGTIVRLPDRREGTVVYHGLDGDGIKWGRHKLTAEDVALICSGSGGCLDDKFPDDYDWFAEAMLRDPYPSADVECVGEDYEVVTE